MTTFFPTPEEVTIRDKAISISPLAVKNLSKAARCATPLMGAFKEGAVDPMVVLTNADAVIELVALATNQTEEYIGELNSGELLQLLASILKVNMDFFSQVIVPQIQGLLKTVETVAPKN